MNKTIPFALTRRKSNKPFDGSRVGFEERPDDVGRRLEASETFPVLAVEPLIVSDSRDHRLWRNTALPHAQRRSSSSINLGGRNQKDSTPIFSSTLSSASLYSGPKSLSSPVHPTLRMALLRLFVQDQGPSWPRPEQDFVLIAEGCIIHALLSRQRSVSESQSHLVSATEKRCKGA